MHLLKVCRHVGIVQDPWYIATCWHSRRPLHKCSRGLGRVSVWYPAMSYVCMPYEWGEVLVCGDRV